MSWMEWYWHEPNKRCVHLILGLSEFTLFLPAVNATVQVMTIVLTGHDSDYSSVTILLTEHFHKYSFIFWHKISIFILTSQIEKFLTWVRKSTPIHSWLSWNIFLVCVHLEVKSGWWPTAISLNTKRGNGLLPIN